MTAGYAPALWANLFLAGGTAAATLCGLIFVAVSVNLGRILEFDAAASTRHLSGRALDAIVGLLLALTVCLLGLVPQPLAALGGELAAAALAAAAVPVRVLLHRGTRTVPHRRAQLMRLGLGLTAALCLLAAGCTTAARAGGGLYWAVPGILLAIAGATTNAWILLIEIYR